MLDGFKRYRCAKKLGIGIVPYRSLGRDEATGIIELIRLSNATSLGILEQAKLIDELKSVHHMSVSEIARLVDKSKGWVGMRVGIIGQMSPLVMGKIFDGKFPVYAYMYTLRPFIRMNGVNKNEIDEFVGSVAGKKLSIRDIEILAHGYFKGSDELRKQIKNGDILWALSRLKADISQMPAIAPSWKDRCSGNLRSRKNTCKGSPAKARIKDLPRTVFLPRPIFYPAVS